MKYYKNFLFSGKSKIDRFINLRSLAGIAEVILCREEDLLSAPTLVVVLLPL